MKTLDTGKDRIQKICDKLRVDTLQPAQEEAARIVEEARVRAEEILGQARAEAAAHLEEVRKRIKQEQNVFESSLAQTGKQTIEALRQSIEKDLFNDQMAATLEKELSDPKVVARILEALVTAIVKEGISADFSAILPKTVSQEEVARSLGEGVYKKLQKHPFTVSDFHGGVQIKLIDRKMTIDMSDRTLKELIAQYVRKDFYALIFGG